MPCNTINTLAPQTIHVDTSNLPFVFTPNWPSNLTNFTVVSMTPNISLTINSTTGVVTVQSMTNNKQANGNFSAISTSGSVCYTLKVIIIPSASSADYGFIKPSGTGHNIGGQGNPHVSTAKARDTSMNWE
jgi:hypothetical protein